jgi:predicted alpha/beta-hydrolase family hydrolase
MGASAPEGREGGPSVRNDVSIQTDHTLVSRPAEVRLAVSEKISVDIAPDQGVTAIAYPAERERAGITLILAPGAGADQTSAFMVRFATDLSTRGIDVVTFNFSYMEHGRRVPDRNDKLEAYYRAVIETVRDHKNFSRQPLAIGGKSMGGRIASQVAAAGMGDLAGLVLLGYPLHPPGKPEQLRVKHLPAITTPILIVQGSRDAFGTLDELRSVIAAIKAPTTLHVVDGADHSFKVPKRASVPQEAVYTAIEDEIVGWLRALLR